MPFPKGQKVPVTFTVHNFWNLTAHGLTPAATKPIA